MTGPDHDDMDVAPADAGAAPEDEAAHEQRVLTRRRLLAVGGGGALLAVGAGAGFAMGQESDENAVQHDNTVAFFGAHQAGIATPSPDRLVFAAFDLTATTAGQVQDMLKAWTDAAVKMTAGQPVGPVAGQPLAPPIDTGEATDLPAANLTITFGFGPSMFDDRFGLARKRPALLRPLGPLPGEELVPSASDGDLCVQACADDPQVAFHVVRNLARIARGTAVLRWTQLGFGRAANSTATQTTPRNLMGFKDGTNNIDANDTKTMDRFVWVGRDEPQAWMRGGSYLVSRRIRMRIEGWDRANLLDQEQTIGRFKVSGAPLSGGREHTPLRLKAKDSGGQLAIPANAHVRLADPKVNEGIRILRRGYNYTDGVDPATGQLDAGLFFIAFQKDPHQQFVPLQTRLGSSDALNEYILHTSSGLFATPGGITQGEYVGQSLFA